MKAIGEFCEQIRGVTYKGTESRKIEQDGYKPILRANNISSGKLLFDDLVYVPSECINKRQVLKKGDILIAASSGSLNIVGKAGYVEDNVDFSFGAFCKLLRPNGKIECKYLFYFFCSERYRATISSIAIGANINNLRNEHISNLRIPVPSLQDQKQIVQTLDTADTLRQKRKDQLNLLDDYLESVFFEMFGDPVRNEKGHQITPIRKVVTEVKYGTSKKANANNGEFPILRMSNITYSGEWNLADLKYIDLTTNEIEKYTVKKGDLLFNRTNSKELVGKTAIFNSDQVMAYAGYLIRCRFDKKKANSVYVSYFLNSSYGKSKLSHMCKNIVGMANINAQELQDINIILPPIDLQNKFASIVEQVDQAKQKMRASLDEMDNHFNALMQRYFG